MTAAEVEREVTTTISLGVRPVVDGQVNLDTLIQSLDADNQKVVAQVLAATEPTALLLVLKGAGVGGRYLLDTAETKIGRDINNEICLDDITVSRSHALISKSDGYTIKDLGSLNGTYLNAVVVREAKINAGDEVQIGKYHLTLFIGGNK